MKETERKEVRKMTSNLGNKETMEKNIRRYLSRKGITITALSDALNVPYNTVNNWANGVSYPRIDKIERMSEFFGCTKADLVEEESTLRAEVLEKAFGDRPEMRDLFEAADKATPEDIERVIKILNAFNAD